MNQTIMDIDELLSRYAAGERDFGAINLQSANLTGLVLNGVNLSGANLSNADLSEARLRGADNFHPDQFKQAILTGAEMPDGTIHD